MSLPPAPPFTLNNVMAAVEGVRNWNILSGWLGVDFNRHQYNSDEACVKAIMEKFLLGKGDYQPTWKALIYCLDEAEEVHLADKIRSFGEPVQGECTCSITL